MFAYLQRIGRALMLPIAVLPAAGLLLRLGQDDVWKLIGLGTLLPTGIPFMAHAGGAIFDNRPLLFAIGVAAGFTADVGTAALSGGVGYWVFTKVLGDVGAFAYGD